MRKSAFVIILLFGAIVISAQENDTIRRPSDKVEVVKNYEAIILQAQKKEIDIKQREQTFTPVNFQYAQKSPKAIEFERPDPVIQALGYKENQRRDEDLKDGNIYGGYGNLNTINGGAAYHYYIEDWIEAGFKVDHFSAKNKDLAFQKFANTTSNLYAGYYFNPRTKIKLDLRGDFDRHYSDSLLVEDEFYTRQAYNRTGANL
ncbi:MAG: hypothetical protein KJO29_10995, partial [Bacteroidia bacterium]|nr:hypothetical protein [Bacteroidia bacterium]